MLWFHHALLVSISCQNPRDISCSYQQQLLLAVGSPRGETDGSVVTWVSPDTGHSSVPSRQQLGKGWAPWAGLSPLGWAEVGLYPRVGLGRCHPGLLWALCTIPNNHFLPEMASCKWNSRDSEKVFNRSFRRRIEECGNKPPPFLTLSESCSAMNCL